MGSRAEFTDSMRCQDHSTAGEKLRKLKEKAGQEEEIPKRDPKM